MPICHTPMGPPSLHLSFPLVCAGSLVTFECPATSLSWQHFISLLPVLFLSSFLSFNLTLFYVLWSEGVRSFVTGATDSCELPRACWELNLGLACSLRENFISNDSSSGRTAALSAGLHTLGLPECQGGHPGKVAGALFGEQVIFSGKSFGKRKLQYRALQRGFLGARSPVTQDWLGAEPTGALGIGQGWKRLKLRETEGRRVHLGGRESTHLPQSRPDSSLLITVPGCPVWNLAWRSGQDRTGLLPGETVPQPRM